METFYIINIAGDVGTYKAVLMQSLKKELSEAGIHCQFLMQDEAILNAFNIFVTTSKSEFHNEPNQKILNTFDVVLDIDTTSEEEVSECAIELFVRWMD